MNEEDNALNSHPGEIFETFCYMVAEDFLRRKGLDETLALFREEYERPAEDNIINSWYEVALKLRLPELISQNSKSLSVLENLVQALIRESSIRCRQSPDVLVSGFATLPRPSSLPAIVDHSHSKSTPPTPNNATDGPATGKVVPEKHTDNKGNANKRSAAATSSPRAYLIKSKLPDSPDKYHMLRSKQAGGTLQQSNENWIPEEIRMRSMLRDLSVAKDTYTAVRKRELGYEKEIKRLQVTDLDRARTEESLAATRKIPCGCCTQMFLYVNLPLKVSRKAILDIRIKWSGKLSSSSVFGKVDDEFDGVDDASSAAMSIESGVHSRSMSKKTMKQLKQKEQTELFTGGNLGQVPRCYDQVGVCVFCAQFFLVQEDYRPSFLAITQQERRQAYQEAKQREQEYWDPLKMIEKDRQMMADAISNDDGAKNSSSTSHGIAGATEVVHADDDAVAEDHP